MISSDQAELALRLVREAPVIAYDVETSGLDWRRQYVVGYVITESADVNTYTPVRHAGGGNLPGLASLPEGSMVENASLLPIHSWEQELQKAFLERRTKPGFVTIGHHIKFDQHFSCNHGVSLGRQMEDTQLNASLLNEHAGSYSLDACCRRERVTAKLGDELYQHLAGLFGGVADRKQMSNFWRLAGDDPVGVEYALGDGVSTLALRSAQLPQIMEEYEPGFSLEKVWRLESDLIWTTFRMERRGIKVDLDQLQRVKQILAGMEAEARSVLPEGFNVRSTAQTQAWLEAQGFTEFERTEPSSRFPDGQVSIRQKWLEDCPVGKPIVALRKVMDLASKFLKPLEERHIFNGRVHSSFEQMRGDDFGTISGRYSSHDSNLQQLSSRDKVLGKLLRSVFVADDGKEMFEADYKAAEPRTFAHFTKAKFLMDGFCATPPMDVHAIMAGKLGLDRDTSKRAFMGVVTGQSFGGFCKHLGWPSEKAEPIYYGMHKEFPELMEFHKAARNACKIRGYVKSIIGRKFTLDDPQYAYRAVSRIVQGNDADILKWKMLEFDRACEDAGDDINLNATVHDSIVGQFPPGGRALVTELIEQFSDVQSPPFSLRVPFECDVGFGKTWAECKFPEKK
jgi:DNA polymerase I-like protein with 3'-5' exonuclease and polymerase domains